MIYADTSFSRVIKLDPYGIRLALLALQDPKGVYPYAVTGNDRTGYLLWVNSGTLEHLLSYPAWSVRQRVKDGLA